MKHFLFLFVVVLQAGCTSMQYQVKNEKVHFCVRSWNHGPLDYVIEGADVSSFRALGDNYAADNAHVYYRSTRIENADPRSFKILQDGYSKDRNHVFLQTCTLPAADPDSFVQINAFWTKDKNRVYQGYSIVPEATPSNFRYLQKNWAIDQKRAYHHLGWVSTNCTASDPHLKLKIFEDIDPATFEVIDSFHAKDTKRHYDALK
jgi:hypothetical protein